MQGARTLFNYFENPTPPPAPVRKGRSAAEIARRNEYILHRFWYIRSTQPKISWDAILEQLNDEVWLSITTIAEIIGDNKDGLAMLKANPPSMKLLQEKWKHVKW